MRRLLLDAGEKKVRDTLTAFGHLVGDLEYCDLLDYAEGVLAQDEDLTEAILGVK